MIRKYWLPACLLAGLGLATTGCARWFNSDSCKLSDAPVGRPDLPHYRNVALEIEYPAVCTSRDPAVVGAEPPRTITDPGALNYWDLTLEQAMQIALANSKVIRDLGGRTLSAPTTVSSIYDPSLQESNPINGVEAALSAFDAQLNSAAVWARTDRPTGQQAPNLFPGVSAQDNLTAVTQLSKITANGSQYILRNNTGYLETNNPISQFPSSWTTNMEAEFRQPLLQGRGIEFNRIAGPNATPGLFQARGVLLARTNTDLALADFETAVRNFASDVENAYWDLYFAYRTLDAQLAGRDAALGTWRQINNLRDAGARGGEKANEAQARNQYFQFQAQVEDAFSGRATGSTQTGGVAGGGAFGGAGGVLAREQNLRFLLGLAPNDGRLIRPTGDPGLVKVDFSWDSALGEALTRRVELRRQRWTIKQREMQLIASRNFVQPRLDASGIYRWYGFGDRLYGQGDAPPFNSAVQNMFDGDFQEWQLGVNFSMPIGFRQALAGVRNAELALTRDRVVLETQELQIVHTLGSAFRELERSYRLAATNFNRRIAAMAQVEAISDQVEFGVATLNVLLEAQRDQADAEVAMYQALVEYQLAIKGIHFEKGTLLEYDGIYLQEGPWPIKAYQDAGRLAERFRTRHIDYGMELPDNFAGTYPQRSLTNPNRVIVEEVRGPTEAQPRDGSESLPPIVNDNSDAGPMNAAPQRDSAPVPPAIPTPPPPGEASKSSPTPAVATRPAFMPAVRPTAAKPERLPKSTLPAAEYGFSVSDARGSQRDLEASAAPIRLPAVETESPANPFYIPAPRPAANEVQPASYEPTNIELPSGAAVYTVE